MTDHAAEAQRHLRSLMDMETTENWPPERLDAYDRYADVHTGRALLAIAHTLQAIHELLGRTGSHASGYQCTSWGPDGNNWPTSEGENYRCERHEGHTGNHADAEGHHW